ncbi:MAG: DUF72 domain-containing protein [Nitrososphaeria archaeon]
MEIYVGCCGTPGGLKNYSREFKVAEINSTFYRIPKIETVQRWRETVPEDFIFTVKCHQAITHPITSPTWKKSGIKDFVKLKDKVGFLNPTEEVIGYWKETVEVCRVLKSPVCLIQLPASFKQDEKSLEKMRKFFSKIERDNIMIALELRGWRKDEFKRVCEEFDLISCVDPLKDEPLYFSKKGIGYYRLHGNYLGGRIDYRYKYTVEDLKRLRTKIEEYNCNIAYVMFNNVYMKENAKEFMRLLSK